MYSIATAKAKGWHEIRWGSIAVCVFHRTEVGNIFYSSVRAWAGAFALNLSINLHIGLAETRWFLQYGRKTFNYPFNRLKSLSQPIAFEHIRIAIKSKEDPFNLYTFRYDSASAINIEHS